MSAKYQAVQWNRQKWLYDAIVIASIAAWIYGFQWLAAALDPNFDAKTAEIRAWGSAAFVLLHVILAIGPLARLDPRFLPFLYNRRHLGVLTCAVAIQHADLAVGWYHAFGNLDPWVSLLVSNTEIGSLTRFPFEWLGLGALAILILMAVTSHDFWLANLTAPVWKALHMGVYAAYALLVGHVALGALQTNPSPALALLVAAGALGIVGLHLAAARREAPGDVEAPAGDDGWVEVGAPDSIPENRARIVFAAGERIAVFRYDGKLSAISNVCQHQNGPLGEGCIVDGLVTCPWHGFQYDPASGAAPEPFDEKLPTFSLTLRDGRVFVDPRPHPPGTAVPPLEWRAAEVPA